jgi:hypothetical protein
MRLRLPHAPYIANKISIDLLNSGLVTMTKGLEPVAQVAKEILEADIKKEEALEAKVMDILDENEDEIEFQNIDRRQMFWMVKRKLADEFGVILSYEDRYNNTAHEILDRIYDEYMVEYSVSENMVKNIIYGAIEGYISSFEAIEGIVLEKMDHYKKKLIPGTEDYDIVFERLYEEELKKKGMI